MISEIITIMYVTKSTLSIKANGFQNIFNIQ